jgi:hypothetical protein
MHDKRWELELDQLYNSSYHLRVMNDLIFDEKVDWDITITPSYNY